MHDWPTVLVSSSHFVELVSPNMSRVIHEGMGLYYGLTWDSENIYVGYRGTNSKDPLERVQSIVVLDKGYTQISKLPGSFPAIHQIFYVDDRLYVTATDRDAIYAINSSGERQIHDWIGHGKDVHHINSIFKTGDHFWVCYHNLDGRSTVEKKSQMVKLSANFNVVEEVHSMGKSSHNVFVDKDYIYTCNSNAGSIMRKNRSTGVLESTVLGGWTRGLAVTDAVIVTGSSDRGASGARDFGSLTLHMLDRETLQLMDERYFPARGGIYDLRVVSELDHAHNGVVFPGEMDV